MQHKNTSWGNVSEWYDSTVEDSDSYQQKVLLPNLLRIVAPHKDMKILDVGCGTGFFSRAFATAGAEVIGVDIGEELIRIARKKSPHIRFAVASADKLVAVEDGKFDVATIVLALQNMEHLDKVVREVASKLAKDGRFVIVLNHPAFRVPQMSDWYFDERLRIQYRKVGKYMSEFEAAILMNPGNKDSEKTLSFHRPLQRYIECLAKNGFHITGLEEWVSHKESGRGPRKHAEDRARKEIPLFMCLECVKR